MRPSPTQRIMAKMILAMLRMRRGEKIAPILSVRQRMLLVAVLGVLLLCYLVVGPGQSIGEAAYRMTWLVLSGVALTIFYSVDHTRQELNMGRSVLVMTLICAQIGLIHAFNNIREMLPWQVTYGQMLLALPYALAPGITSAMLGRRLGVFTALCTSLFGLALMPPDCPRVIMQDFFVISLLAGLISALLCSRVHKREHILYAGFATGAVILVSTIALGCFQDNGLATLRGGFDPTSFLLETLVAFGVSFLVSVFIGGFMPLLESLFNISTHITWLEWADMNHPVLKKLQMTAPGTFHHSLYVQRLAEAAAEAIGADVTRAGVCGLYHDIGKLKNPQYFTENIGNQAISPHNELTPEVSARIIIQHVQDGVDLAREYKLNSRIIAAIREHHGTLSTYFFYRKAMDRYKEEKAKFDAGSIDTCPEEVDKAVFSYKGPIPQTRESGIVSMADAVESAARSLTNPTEQDIRELVEKIFRDRILDGHLQDCQITLGDIEKMKESFLTTLRTMNHNRIAYPKPESEAVSQEAASSASGGTPAAS